MSMKHGVFPIVLLAIAVAGGVLPTFLGSALVLTLLTQAVINAILATGVGFLVRQNGLVSFGHAAFFGLGAYIVALSATYHVMPIGLALVLAVLAPALLALLLGLAILRLVGVAFSMLTLAIAQAIYELVLHWRELANGDDGIAADLPPRILGLDLTLFQQPGSMFLICWVVLIVMLFGLRLLVDSPFGTLTLAIRENEERARFVGFETILPRAIVYAISAAIAALAGVLFALYNGFVTPDVLYWSLSGEALVMAVIGGTRAVWGPALGAVVFFLFKDAAGDLTEHWPAIIGTTLIVVTVLLPRGVSGTVAMLLERLGARTR
jgi:branched-chain amino acid transport system permease protein